MSDTELHRGKLVKVTKTHESESINEVCERILKENGININPEKSVIGQLIDNLQYEKKYFIFKNELYQANNEELDSYDSFCEMNINEDGSINYITSFYNGGTCFSEMIEHKLDKLK